MASQPKIFGFGYFELVCRVARTWLLNLAELPILQVFIGSDNISKTAVNGTLAIHNNYCVQLEIGFG